jgi:hypothetical protein
MVKKPWTDNELEFVLANRHRLKLAALAKRLGRSKASVVNALVYYGHSKKKTPRASWEGKLRRLHAGGLTDLEMSVRLGCSRAAAQRRRVRLGLSPNPYPGHAGRYRRQMENADASNLIDLRWRPARVARLVSGEGR